MWSLFKRDKETERKVEPLVFSNGKTQEDVVKEVLEKFKQGKKIIFIKGVCGSGKSAIALNIAKHFRKASIVVPLKTLQKQYEEDYTFKNFIKKENGEKLRISIIKGRKDFHCNYCNCKADEKNLPCNIEIKEKNLDKIKEYLKESSLIDTDSLNDLSKIKRAAIASICPYWSPVLPYKGNLKFLEKSEKKEYYSLNEKKFFFYKRKEKCEYYYQYENYIDSDVIIFNSKKYLIETAIGRKPKTEVDIIDECDAFLDELTTQKRIHLNRLYSSLISLLNEKKENEIQIIKEMIRVINEIKKEKNREIEKVAQSNFLLLMKKILSHPDLAIEDEDNYYNNVLEVCRHFEGLEEKTFISYEYLDKKDSLLEEDIVLNIASTDISSCLKDIIQKTSLLVLMSGTLHSEKVIKEFFGIEEFEIIEAETKLPGEVKVIKTGLEKNCKYENFRFGVIKREDYLRALEECIKRAHPPVLIHVTSFQDLPTEEEKKKFSLKKLISKEELFKIQEKSQENIEEFKRRKTLFLYTTKCNRGIDFPGEQCNSVVITRYPYPDINNLFWKILKKQYPKKFMYFYIDKAKREITQRILRAVRFKGDSVFLLSPDSRVLDLEIS
ncbi:MAG: helicase C-terminal domain-containing protein [Candidatus Pacearchaeota archaeon]